MTHNLNRRYLLMDEINTPRKRRIRYSGTHPRRFEEKYKELQPDRYSDDVKRVLDRGQTPAGTHRPVCVHEVLEYLRPQPGDIGLDATLGYGGHARELLGRILPGGRLYGIDVDPVELPKTEFRLRESGFTEDHLIVKRMNFAGAQRLLSDVPEGFDFVFADLGVSSMQLDTPSRGFSYKIDGPLDLRLNPNKGQPASVLLSALEKEDLEKLLKENADEPHAAAIAGALKSRRLLATTKQLAAIVEEALQRVIRGGSAEERKEEIKKSQQRTFQALRIAVNDEFGVLDLFLKQLPTFLKSGGRVVILSFHSGEDRRVKKSFISGLRSGIYREIAPDPVRPSPQERHDNPRCACVKLRWAVRS